MVLNQKCKNCRKTFPDDADERNYNNFAKYGFKTKEDFEKHSSRNKRCPCNDRGEYKEDTVSPQIDSSSVVDWPEYKSPCEMRDSEDYMDEQLILQTTLNSHIRKIGNGINKELWFRTSEIAAWDIVSQILKKDIKYVSLVAQPGSGKTAVIHCFIYICISQIEYIQSRTPDNITLTTGMSDTSWYNQTLSNFTIPDGTGKKFLWNSLNDVDKNHCLVHRSNLFHRITYLLKQPELISNHIFIIDESHFADSKDMTIDDQLKRLGLTFERMEKYNIKIVLVSATPDVTLSMMEGNDNHAQVQLSTDKGYKGFKYYKENNMIQDYNTVIPNILKIAQLIEQRWSRTSDPRYHFIRIRKSSKCDDRNELIQSIEQYGYILFELDSYHGEIVIANNETEYAQLKCQIRKPSLPPLTIIRIYERPSEHTVIILADKFRASKRLALTPYIGLVAEKPAKQQNTTVTSNGLVPRWFAYQNKQEYSKQPSPLFLCNIDCVNEYIRFTDIPYGEKWTYIRKDYTSQRIKSNTLQTRELKETCYSKLGGINPTTKNNDPRSCPIVLIPLNKQDIDNLNGQDDYCEDFVNALIQPEVIEQYSNYNRHYWKIDSEHKREKWLVNRMKQPGAKSTRTNVRYVEQDELMVYLLCPLSNEEEQEYMIIIHPWNGTAL